MQVVLTLTAGLSVVTSTLPAVRAAPLTALAQPPLLLRWEPVRTVCKHEETGTEPISEINSRTYVMDLRYCASSSGRPGVVVLSEIQVGEVTGWENSSNELSW